MENIETGEQQVIPGGNVVTDDGDTYYARSAVSGVFLTTDFSGLNAGLRLGSANTAPGKANTDVLTFLVNTIHAADSGYETVGDTDSDNTGAGVDIVTWRYSYTTAEGNVTTIVEGAIVDNRTTPTKALTRFTFAAAFTKTSTDTLKIFVNHTFNGT